MKAVFTLLLILYYCLSANSNTIIDTNSIQKTVVVGFTPDSITTQNQKKIPSNQKIKPKRRLVAALLCITLGPFGMHRLYLGTQPQVAAAYTLTLGGGCGLITVVDLFHIVFSPDISRFKNNNQFIMWKKE